jgi:trk system potassium uptake protein TrkH
MISVLHILSRAFGGLALAMLVPAVIAVVSADGAAASFLLVSGLTGFLAGAVFFALQGHKPRFDRTAGFVLAAALWVAIPLIAALPFALHRHIGYVAGLFEAVYGFTTTGATIFRSLADVGPSLVFWRAELQWLGGLATLVTFVTILAPAGVGGLSSRGLAPLGGFSEAGPERIVEGLRRMVTVYTLFTGICIILLFLSGVPTFDAICLAMSTVSTGGFMPVDGNLSAYGSPYAEAVIALFMIVGATSVVFHRSVLEGRWSTLLGHRETWWVVGAMAVVGVLYGWAFYTGENHAAALGEGLFHSISLISTTGYETRAGALSAIPDTLVLFLAIGGAAALSTAGGLKYYRIGAMTVQSMHDLKRLLFPHSVRSTRFGSQPYDLNLMKAVWANLVVAVTIIVVAALAFSIDLPAFDAAMVAAVSAFSNIGPLYSQEWLIGPNWPAYADFGVFCQLAMIITMILGRIEVIVLFASLYAAYWRA